MNLRGLICVSVFFVASAHGQSVSAEKGNIIITDGSGSARELTNTGRDSEPALSPDGKLVVFVRATPERKVESGSGDDTSEIWLVHADGTRPVTLVKPRAAESMKEVVEFCSAPQFSSDGRRVFFETTAWVTSGAVHVVDLGTGKERFFCPGNNLEVVRSGEYRDCLLVQQHRYFIGGGSYDWFWLLRPNGKEVGPVGEDTVMFKETYSLTEPTRDR